MMRHDVEAFKPSVEMYLTNNYKFKFEHIASAFLRIQINENTRFIRTTIPHISQIDENKFQFVRRMETPL